MMKEIKDALKNEVLLDALKDEVHFWSVNLWLEMKSEKKKSMEFSYVLANLVEANGKMFLTEWFFCGFEGISWNILLEKVSFYLFESINAQIFIQK